MDYVNKDALVSTAWLADHLSAPDVRVVDASWYLPALKRDSKTEYAAQHIPGAVFFDIDEIADTDNPLPHMLPSAEKFSARMRKLGLGDGNRIVVYDGGAMSSAARAWWTFRVFGHNDIAVLDGGFRKWLREGRRVETSAPNPRERHLTARFNHALVRDVEQVKRNVNSAREQVLDARPAARFSASEPEPRPGLRGGHIPGSLNLPVNLLVDQESGTMKPADELLRLFKDAGIDMQRPVVTTCGSGITASHLALALHLLGHKDVAVYDGSWSEWGSRSDTPVETGAAPRKVS
ncbi:MAG TPA: 3-mercaptopyruvate sulfurtransferase [Alphaproteobacteria bacterium]|nr:3-mercaptopyruvate sulfurtransferase [Alphaproteobacteria bacterium]